MRFTRILKKRNIKLIFLVCVFLCFFSGINKVFALNDSKVEVEDKADLLTSNEETEILKRTKQILNDNNKTWNVNIFTTNDSQGKSTETYGIDRYEEVNDPDHTGKVLNGFFIIIDIDNRNYHFGTFGEAINIFDDFEVEKLLDSMFDDVRNEEYFSAFVAALDSIEMRLQIGDNDDSNDGNNSLTQTRSFDFVSPIFIGLVFGVGAAFMYFIKVVKDYDKYENKPMFNFAKNAIAEYSEFEDLISNRQSYRVYRPLPRENLSNSGTHNSYSGGSSMSGGGRSVGGGGRSF